MIVILILMIDQKTSTAPANGLVQPWGEPHEKLSKVMAVVGPYTSTKALTVAPLLMMNHIPMISYGAATSAFSIKQKFPYFLRTVQPNKDVIELIVGILQHFNWRWVAFLYIDDDYGNNGLELFLKKIENTEICLAYNKGLNTITSHSQIFKQINSQKIGAIIVFAPEWTAEALIVSAINQNVTNKVWIASDAWSLNKNLPKKKGIRNIGTVIGVSEKRVTIPGFSDFIHFSRRHTYCENASQNIHCNQVCNCSSLSAKDVVAADPSFNFPVYSAVYAIAHALHNALQCGSGRCNDNITVFPHMLLAELKKSNFTLLNQSIRFDENEDAYRCIDCKDTEWSAAGNTSCNLREVEYIPFTDDGAILIILGAWALVGFTLAVSVLFAINYNTPVVRSAGGPMCFLILVCLSLCSITAKFPKLHSWWIKYHGQWLVITVAFGIQALLLLIGYTCSPPESNKDTDLYPDKIILGCDLNLKATSGPVLFLLSLCFLCFIFSYMGKDLPENYNEAKAITFCLLLLILTWILFATTFVLYHGKYIPILNALAILSSLYSFLVWYFIPKCYIMIFQSYKNTQEYFQGLILNYTKTICQ
ncbi:hypothetical protein NQZ68_000468 [Dissostichus eleginoides]|nr:hypothetical protein NQZ68_000468 [Dissostichus eleginoides]